MSRIDTGIYGAKVQSWRAANPRDLLKRLIAGKQSLSMRDALTAFCDEIERPENEEYRHSVFEYWFSNNYRSLIDPTPQSAKAAAAKAAAVKAATAKAEEESKHAARGIVQARIEQEAKTILLDIILPNGKALRDCTGRECAKLGGKVGAWLGRIAAKVKPGDVVGDVLDEAEVRKMYGR
jgi:hypothetical protein